MCLKLVTFDATGTIFKFKNSPVLDYINVSKSYGFSVNEAAVKDQFRFAMKKMEANYPNFGAGSNIDSMMWWTNVVQDTLHGAGDKSLSRDIYKPVAIHLYKLYWTSAPYMVCKDFVHFARRLRINYPNINTGVISNFDKRLTSVLAQLGVAPLIDFVVTSEEAGASKPQVDIFKAALKKLGNTQIQPHEILHVGDDLEKDYFGSKRLGWNAIVLNRDSLPLSKFLDVPKEDISEDFMEIDDIFDKRFQKPRQ